MKAYTTEDGHIVTFRPDLERRAYCSTPQQDWKCQYSRKIVLLTPLFKTIKANAAYVPPYGSGATLYVRPYMFGSNPVIGVKPADEYQFRVS